jgi:hypothetical protein
MKRVVQFANIVGTDNQEITAKIINEFLCWCKGAVSKHQRYVKKQKI